MGWVSGLFILYLFCWSTRHLGPGSMIIYYITPDFYARCKVVGHTQLSKVERPQIFLKRYQQSVRREPLPD